MIFKNALNDIIEKNNKTKLTLYLGVTPFLILIIGILLYESQIVQVQKKYKTNIKIKSDEVPFYKNGFDINSKKISKKYILHYLNSYNDVIYLDSVSNNWSKIIYGEDTGLVQSKNITLSKVLVEEKIIKRYSSNTSKDYFKYALLFTLFILYIYFLNRFDQNRRIVHLEYLSFDGYQLFHNRLESIKAKLNNHFIWAILNETKTSGYKSNSGAGTSITRVEVKLFDNILPFPNLKCDINIPGISFNSVNFYFFPDVLVRKIANDVSCFSYADIKIDMSNTRFVESEKKSSALEVLSYTYQYVNKNGAPDKRYSYNPKYPICNYSEYNISYEGNDLLSLLCSNPSLLNLSVNDIKNNKKGANSNKEYFLLVDDLKSQAIQIAEELNDNKDLNYFITKNLDTSSNANSNKLIPICILYDVLKINRTVINAFESTPLHQLLILSIIGRIVPDFQDINRYNNDELLDEINSNRLRGLLDKVTELSKIKNPINISINEKNEKSEYSLPNLLKYSNSKFYDKYCTFLYRLASVLAKTDNHISIEEEELLKKIYSQLDLKKSSSKKNENSESKGSQKSLEECLQELNNLIGLEDVKNEVSSLINFVQFQQERQRHGLKQNEVSYHCVFTGSPGTGKTTVARILASIFQSLQVIEKGHLVETDRSGMIAEYVGQTAVKVDKLINEAMGGVLFIDEAYSLSTESSEDFGKEAIATLLKRMEDNRDNLIVIVAGYTDKMKNFIDLNPGLKSRFNRYIQFDDYKPEQLIEIFKKMCHSSDYHLISEAEEKLIILFKAAYENRDESFGNGRYVRNIFEKTIENLSNRISKSENITRELLTNIVPDDISN